MTKNYDELSEYVFQFKGIHGIYKITNISNGKIYIGSAVNIYDRWYKHKSDLIKNRHRNSYLQSSWNKYGEASFLFEVVEVVNDKQDLISREQFWIDALDVCNRKIGYNLAPKAGSMLGFRHSKESLEKISKNRTGIGHSEETKKKMSITRTGMKRTEEQKKKMSILKTGFRHTEETKRKISEVQKGTIRGARSEEVKRKIGEKNKGRTTMPKGEDMYNSSLTNTEVEEIKLKMISGTDNNELAIEYNVSPTVMSYIRTGQTYKNVRPDIDLTKTYNKKLTKEDALEIRRLLANGVNIKELALKFNKSLKTIRQIRNYETWKSI